MQGRQSADAASAVKAQLNKAKGVYSGQIVTDAGGNQLMLDNGPVTCKVKG